MSKLGVSLTIAGTLLIIALWIAIQNYNECRMRGFSKLYCVTTHLVR